jgi:hypothetical protein
MPGSRRCLDKGQHRKTVEVTEVAMLEFWRGREGFQKAFFTPVFAGP